MKVSHLTPDQLALIDAGLARVQDGVLVPVICGGDGTDEPLFTPLPDNLDALSAEELAELAAEIQGQLAAVAASPADYVSDTFTDASLLDAASAAHASLAEIRAASEALAAGEEPDEEDEPETEVETETETASVAPEVADALSALVEPAVEPVVETASAELEVVTAAATPPAVVPPRPARSRAAAPVVAAIPRVSLTAASNVLADFEIGDEIPTFAVAEAMLKRWSLFGAPTGERHIVAKANWRDSYPADRVLTGDAIKNMALIAAATDQQEIQAEMGRRRKSLTASGGWCAPVVPYYDLPVFGSTDRPVRDALPAFNASRGGISHARPASLASITDAVGIVTAAEDEQGGTFGAKSCQVPDCPDFTDVQTNAVFHCLQWGNMVARAYPELVAQWTDLTMTALARLAESYLLTRIDTMSTAVTAHGVTLGATSTLLTQALTAAVALRNRHRLDKNTVLRAMFPEWVVPLMVSDVIKSQFQRFDTDEAKITAMLRQFNIEPTFYKDGATGAGQVFGAQNAGTLLTFPTHVRWYLYPEGSFLYLDSGTLEIGLVRDSILVASNDFQQFGEFFENVAFVGVEALAIDSAVCDSGVVAAPADVSCPTSFS